MTIPTNDQQAEVNKNALLRAIQHKHVNIHQDVTIINMIFDTLYDLEAYNVYYVDEFFRELDVSSLHPDIIGTLEGACSNLTMNSVLKQSFLSDAKDQYKEKNVTADADERRKKFKWRVVDGSEGTTDAKGNPTLGKVIYETKNYEMYELLNGGASPEDLQALEDVLDS